MSWKWFLFVVWFYISLMANDVEHLSWAGWPLLYPLWSTVCSSALLIFLTYIFHCESLIYICIYILDISHFSITDDPQFMMVWLPIFQLLVVRKQYIFSRIHCLNFDLFLGWRFVVRSFFEMLGSGRERCAHWGNNWHTGWPAVFGFSIQQSTWDIQHFIVKLALC